MTWKTFVWANTAGISTKEHRILSIYQSEASFETFGQSETRFVIFINSFTDQAGENEGDEINPEICRCRDDKRNGKS